MKIKTISMARTAMRGQVYYIKKAKNFMSNEGNGRPAIIVSDNRINQGPKIMVVYLTTQDRGTPYNIPITMKDQTSYAICDNIDTVYKDRLENYIGMIDEATMERIEEKMKESLHLLTDWKDEPLCIGCKEKESNPALKEEAKKAMQERDFYKKAYEDLLGRLIDR